MDNLISEIKQINLSQRKLINENIYIIEYYTEQLRQKDEIIKNTLILKNEEIQNLEKKNNNKKKRRKNREFVPFVILIKVIFYVFPVNTRKHARNALKNIKILV